MEDRDRAGPAEVGGRVGCGPRRRNRTCGGGMREESAPGLAVVACHRVSGALVSQGFGHVL